jgi:hypothetical protein
MNKIWRIAVDVGLVLLATIVTIGVGLFAGKMAFDTPVTIEHLIMEKGLWYLLLGCQGSIGLLMIWALRDQAVHVAETVALVLWPNIFYFQAGYLPQELIIPAFILLIIATFGRLRYHAWKVKTMPALTEGAPPTR